MFNRIVSLSLVIFAAAFIFALPLCTQAGEYSQSITLKPGWNLVSTPRLVESHQFSVAETLGNFDILSARPGKPKRLVNHGRLGPNRIHASLRIFYIQ